MSSNFQQHPSKALNRLYQERNYQGANPKVAKVLFVGKDPNWAVDIEESPIFPLVEAYLSDGVHFWKEQNIHHPFLHETYKGEGRKYHQAIARMNLESSLAEHISFTELIGFPTTGMSSRNHKQFNEYLLSPENRSHLEELDQLLNRPDKLVFMFWGMMHYLKYLNQKTGLFESFADIDKTSMIRTDLNKVGNGYFHKHFSMGISPSTLGKIAEEIRREVG